MTFPFPTGSVNADLWARSLGQALRQMRLYSTSEALEHDPAAFEKMRRDAVVAFALRHRKLLVAGSGWYLAPSKDDDAGRKGVAIVKGLLSQLRRFAAARFNLAEAVIRGSAWSKVVYEERVLDIAGLGPRAWIVPVRMKDVDMRRFRLFPVDGPTLYRTIETAAYDGSRLGGVLDKAFREFDSRDLVPAISLAGASTSPSPGPNGTNAGPPPSLMKMVLPHRQRAWVWQIFEPLQQRWEEFDRDGFVRHVYDEQEATLGYGGGLADELYTYWWAKEQALKNGLQFLERWAQGIIHASVDSLRSQKGSAGNATGAKQRADEWLEVIRIMRTKHVLIHDKQDDFNVIPPPTGGWEAAKDAIGYLDGAIRVLLLGASLPTEAEVDGGSFAMAKVQQGTTETLVRFDRELLEESITDDLIGTIWRLNYRLLADLGIATDSCEPPSFKIHEDKNYDPAARATVALQVLSTGAKIKLTELYEQTGFTPPGPEDLTVSMQQPGVAAGLSALGGSPGAPPVPGQPLPERKPVGEGKSSVAEFSAPVLDSDYGELVGAVALADARGKLNGKH